MWYAMVYYPNLNHDGLNRSREKYDPSYPAFKEHMPFLFPIADSVGQKRLEEHLEQVEDHWSSFRVHFIGMFKSWDHWLLLGVKEGAEKVRQLHKEINSGILEPYLRKDLSFEPHIGMGLFAKDNYDPFSPTDVGFKKVKFYIAIEEAESLNFDFWCNVDVLDLIRGEDIFTKPVTIRKYELT